MAEIFETHEALGLDAETRARRFTRWAGASVVAHAVLLAAMVYVPALRDTFSLANELAGFRVVSKDYNKTKVYERAVLINLAAQKLYYPAGFFDASQQSPNDPQFVAAVAPTPIPVSRPVRVRVRPTPTPSPTPDAAAETANNAENKNAKPGASPSPAASPASTPAQPQTPEEAERIAKEAGVESFPEINTKPFTDLLEQGRKMKDAGEINLSGTVDLEAEADRQEDGRLVNVVVTGGSASDAKLKQLALDFIAALGDSKLLSVLKETRHLRMKVRLDDKQVTVRVATDMPTEDEAAKKSLGFNSLLAGGALKAKLQGKDELVLFTSTRIRNDAKQIVLDFNLPRADASALLTKLSAKSQPTPSPSPGG